MHELAATTAARPAFRYYEFCMAGMVSVLLCANLIGPAKVCSVTLPVLGALFFARGFVNSPRRRQNP